MIRLMVTYKIKIIVYRVVLLTIVSALLALTHSGGTYAVCGAATYGSVTLSASVPKEGEYIVWARYQVPTPAAAALQVEVNNDKCFNIGSTKDTANVWTWTNNEGSAAAVMRYNFATTGTKSIKINGMQVGAKIDKIILIGSTEQCSTNGSVPTGDGTNCDTGAMASGGSMITTPEIVSQAPVENVKQVEYFVDGQLVQVSDKPVGFDTSLVDNGNHILTTKVTYSDNTKAEATQQITVNNPPQRFGSARRWLKRHKTLVNGIGLAVLTASVIAVFVFGLRMYRHKKLFLIHHGLSK